MIADLDTDSKSMDKKDTWISYFKTGHLTLGHTKNRVSITWDETEDVVLQSQIAEKGRGMELSELVVFNGKLYTCDDRTGMVFQITSGYKMLPWVPA